MIRTLASTKFITSIFWHRCWRIDVLNNFLFNFSEFLNYFYLFIYLFIYFYFYLLFVFYYIRKKYIVLNF
ncbi:hypothetical protein ACMBCN_01700 [Candidatus Liberibacter asiaticus]|nr:hypothetical protein [Candidatus Liberibacter asiaticus]